MVSDPPVFDHIHLPVVNLCPSVPSHGDIQCIRRKHAKKVQLSCSTIDGQQWVVFLLLLALNSVRYFSEFRLRGEMMRASECVSSQLLVIAKQYEKSIIINWAWCTARAGIGDLWDDYYQWMHSSIIWLKWCCPAYWPIWQSVCECVNY